ncbi:aldehyde dehydrogenase family protein [Paraburkholderia silvatlantica]|uniref:Betaine-aldehyde dehydrogenase n=1 Tax=Paraburkholderia silvatlantica TaxID=321895 RepID=A0A2U1A8E3_9BURK|nr:aldehyde dehydrogenase family protein [Paraburkholderia silvatlantica]MBB2929051.1 betaine-aldehyde dehydrogenase [Paraburkholderia silvatlantica]PVY29146.1 betaine-aldehyde dehydrogenase [Paraburkholderia silvatlantica]PXW36621.1 betaine-aldehyde dehydrogenase [Paraburkholderia silvatlantica]PYE22105.1 betaine-aldehyde dehydrogenase [Paraburkholderia silvatlantica]TDQ99009.1 betaine-aldehyde dehydrogenase [Paraburkholderia silvatlantica]
MATNNERQIAERRIDGEAFVLPAATIAGESLCAADSEVCSRICNAATGETIGWQQHATAAMVDRAVHAAHDALIAWRHTTPAARGKLLRKIAELVEADRARLAAMQMQVSGKPPFEADLDVSDTIATFNYYAGLCEDASAFAAEAVAVPDDALLAERVHEPVGVAALIVPWNFPMVTTAWKLAPALAAACTVVIKPSELTSPTEHMLAAIVSEAGVPDGVVNVVNGGGDVGAWLTTHPLVDKISFTGSTASGRKVMQAAAQDMKRLTLELGGKSALVVREDADVAQAVSLAVGGAFTNAGQMCSATARILVHDNVYRKFMAAFETAVRAVLVAPPQVADAAMGPLISAAQHARVAALVAQGVEAGAQIAFAGQLDPACADGFFMAPVVIAEPAADNVLWTDEIFGPVACVKSFRSDDEAIAIANDTRYGLVATVVTGDEKAARRYKAQLRAGLVWVNTPQLIFPQVCWGGFGVSGIGRELGVAGLRSYQELRHTVGLRG